MTAPSPLLANLRTRWLTGAVERLAAMSHVRGVALVGSLGRQDADDWSDVDLLVATSARPAVAVTSEACASLGTLAIRTEAPHNTRAGAWSFGATFVVEGLPLPTDWYVVAAATAEWPADSTPVLGSELLRRSELPFGEWNAAGPRGEPPQMTADGVRRARLALVPVAAKQLVRSAPGASVFVELLAEAPFDGSRAHGIERLRRLAAELEPTVAPATTAAIDRYLDLAAAAISQT